MNRLKMHTPDLAADKVSKIQELFPGCVTEGLDEHTGQTRLAVDFDQLRQELTDHVVEGAQERYRLDWPGKREAIALANAPIAKTLRPVHEESVNFEGTQNLLIYGDNLDGLKLIQENYLHSIKVIYIDPPYNTGKDFIFDDDFFEDRSSFLQRTMQADESKGRLVANPDSRGRYHSNWLSMMYPRLRIARNLLREDGVIMVHIDENEYVNLEKILSEIFGEANNLGTIVWDKRNPKGDATGVAQQHEYVSMYAKNFLLFKETVDFRRPKEHAHDMIVKADKLIRANGGVNEGSRNAYRTWLAKQDFTGGEKAYYLIDDNGDIYRPVSMAWPNKKQAPNEYFIPIVHPVTGRNCPVPARGWRNPPETMRRLQRDGRIVFGKDETTQPMRKYLLKENGKENISSLLYFGGSDDQWFREMGIAFDNPKPVEVAKRLIRSVCEGEDIVLDFFAGSGTCGHAVLDLNASEGLNLRYILIQLPTEIENAPAVPPSDVRTIADLCKNRMKMAGEMIGGRSASAGWKRDVGFRLLKVDTSNMKDVHYRPGDIKQSDLLDLVDNVKEGRSADDLLFQVLVDWGVDLGLPIHRKKVQDRTVFFVDGNTLIACFDRGMTDDLVKELARHKPLRAVFRDSGFVSDAMKSNAEQIFRQLSPATEVRSI